MSHKTSFMDLLRTLEICFTIQTLQMYLLLTIMLTCPCNVDPLTLHFYIVKVGFTGLYIFFLIFAFKHSSCVPTIYVFSKMRKNISFFFI